MAVLTSTGLLINRYPEIKNLIQEAMKTNMSASLIFDEDTLLGQIVQILSNELATMEEMLQLLNDARDRDKAEGAALDDLLFLIGLKRLVASRSAGLVSFMVRNNVAIPTGTILANPSSGIRFRTTSSVLAIPSSCRSVWYSLSEIEDEHEYTVTINGVDFTFTYDDEVVGDPATLIIDGLIAVINAVSSELFLASQEGPIDGKLFLAVNSLTSNNINVSSLQYMIPERVEINVPTEAIDAGAILAPAFTVTQLVTGVGGVFTVMNKEAFGTGRLRETDAEFRVRASQELAVSGSATYAAIYTALSNIPEVSEVLLIENSTSGTVDTLPPHSFEAILQIPDTAELNQVVAATLWNEKPIGIASHGNVNSNAGVVYIDSIGQPRTLKFSRPANVEIYVRVTYDLYDEETPPDALSDVIKNAILTYGATLKQGVDVIPRRFIGQIYTDTQGGLANVNVELRLFGDPMPAWSENVIEISPRERAIFAFARITVAENV